MARRHTGNWWVVTTQAGTRSGPAPMSKLVVLMGTAVALIGLAGLLGWALDADRLARPLPDTAGVSPLTAAALLCGAVALLIGGPVSTGWRPTAAHGLAIAMSILGVAGVVDAALDMGIDLNRRVFGSEARMAFTTALAVTFAGAGIATVNHDRRGSWRTQAVLAAAFALGFGGVSGYAFGVELFSGEGRSTEMSPLSALAVCLLVVGAFAARPGRGITPLMVANTVGGRFARRAVPGAFAVPVIFGGLAAAGAEADWFSDRAAVWLATLGGVFTLVPLTVWIGNRLHAEDRLRRDFEERLMRVAQTDPLTGVLNRRAFELELARAAARAGRHDQEHYTVVVLDLDHFKELNDRYGHQTGDEALRLVAGALARRLRGGDVLARSGGDEFVALLAHADPERADRIVEDLTAAVDGVAATLAERGMENRLSASAGAAGLDPDAELPGEDALHRADELMYRAKRAARA